jgi:hypothetical protein
MGAPFAGPQMFENFIAVAPRQVQIQQEKVGAGKLRVEVQAVDKREHLLAVANYIKVTIHLVLAERLPHKPHVGWVILG